MNFLGGFGVCCCVGSGIYNFRLQFEFGIDIGWNLGFFVGI